MTVISRAGARRWPSGLSYATGASELGEVHS